jgi:hypothetical protein
MTLAEAYEVAQQMLDSDDDLNLNQQEKSAIQTIWAAAKIAEKLIDVEERRTALLHDVLARTDWDMLLQQKLQLIDVILERQQAEDPLEGILKWIDAVQDAAFDSGYPVKFLEEEEEVAE